MKRERYALRRDTCVLKSGPCGVYQPASSAEEIVAKGICVPIFQNLKSFIFKEDIYAEEKTRQEGTCLCFRCR